MRPAPACRIAVWLVVLVLARGAAEAAPRDRMAALPDTVLWAWEHPQDLRAVDPRRFGIAYLAQTLRVEGGVVRALARQQPLRLPARAKLVAVTRIETDGSADRGAETLAGLVGRIVSLARPGVLAIQLDFDAARSQRAFYRRLVSRVRAALPDSVGLSITALASWCVDDPWLAAMPVDEIVPMAFRMGRDAESVRRAVALRGEFPCRECRRAVGLATDEAALPLRGHSRIYWFHAGPWDETARAAVAARP